MRSAMLQGAAMAVFKGTGGSEWTFDLPMSEVFNDQAIRGDLVPIDESARTYVTELRAVRGETPEPDPEPESEVEPDPVKDTIDEAVELVRPPEAGPGSSRKAWAAYAEQQGVTVSDDDTRDDIITKLNA